LEAAGSGGKQHGSSRRSFLNGVFNRGYLVVLPETQMQGDLDNIVKPILDAMRKHIYADDKQVERILVQKFEPGKIFRFRAPSQTLATAIQGQKPILYVRVSDNPMEGLV
jgi:crossover junction endodeoxyribonuclease RusA